MPLDSLVFSMALGSRRSELSHASGLIYWQPIGDFILPVSKIALSLFQSCNPCIVRHCSEL